MGGRAQSAMQPTEGRFLSAWSSITAMSSTLRKNCQSEDYRKTLSNRFGWFGTGCSVESAMLLNSLQVMAGVDSFPAANLLQTCYAAGMNRNEILAACRELHSLEALDFYQTVDGEVMAKFTALIDADEMLSPDAAFKAAESMMNQVDEPQGDSVLQSIAKAWARCCNVETVAKTLGLPVDTVQLATVDARAQRAMERVKEQRASLAFR